MICGKKYFFLLNYDFFTWDIIFRDISILCVFAGTPGAVEKPCVCWKTAFYQSSTITPATMIYSHHKMSVKLASFLCWTLQNVVLSPAPNARNLLSCCKFPIMTFRQLCIWFKSPHLVRANFLCGAKNDQIDIEISDLEYAIVQIPHTRRNLTFWFPQEKAKSSENYFNQSRSEM